MSPLGRFLRINLNDHWRAVEKFGSTHRVEVYARDLGLTVLSAKHTVMGMPAVKEPKINYTMLYSNHHYTRLLNLLDYAFV
jgi:hypothetical protein